MNTQFQTWLDTVRRRPLSPAEQSDLDQFLQAHPEFGEQWNEEIALSRLLDALPEPPLSAGFTQRVMQATARPKPSQPLLAFFQYLRLPRPAAASIALLLALALGFAALFFQQQRSQAHMAHSVADLSRQIELAASATELPAIQLLQDFEAIYFLDSSPLLPDEELLAALQ